MASTPPIVIIPAACHHPALYQPLVTALVAHGFEIAVIAIPNVGTYPGMEEFSEDVATVRNVLGELAEIDREIVVLMHSYGGLPGPATFEGLAKL